MNLRQHRLLNWFFYGHFQIALAAAGLSWLSLRLAFGNKPLVNEWPVLSMIFFATLGVYTLHRYLSFQRAGVRPTTERYNIVSRHPRTSLFIGISCLIIAGGISAPFIWHTLPILILAIPLTFFYLTPPFKGWRRLRDVPYIKVLVVAISWTLVTHILPVSIMSEFVDITNSPNNGIIYENILGPRLFTHWKESIVRFLFTLSVAILFDYRDVVLDRSQKVSTIAGKHPKTARRIVYALMLINIGTITFWSCYPTFWSGYPMVYSYLSSLVYALGIGIAWRTHEGRSEAWYAVVVNGLLWGPVVAGFAASHLLE